MVTGGAGSVEVLEVEYAPGGGVGRLLDPVYPDVLVLPGPVPVPLLQEQLHVSRVQYLHRSCI